MTMPNKIKTSLWQKIALVTFGIFLMLVCMEIALRTGALALKYSQEHRNELALKRGGTYRIMCIGESTTQGQYPSFLEEALNKNSIDRKFCVIDKGVRGIDTSTIVSNLRENIVRDSPNMVVAMIGINDNGAHMPAGFSRSSRFFLNSLRVYKSMQLLSLRIQYKIKEIEGSDIFYFELGRRLEAQGQMPRARKALRKAIERNPYNIQARFKLAWTCGREEKMEIIRQAFPFYKKLIETRPDLYNSGITFINHGVNMEELEGLLKELVARNPTNRDALILLGYIRYRQGRYVESEEFLKKAIDIGSGRNISEAFGYLALVYRATKRFELSEQCLRMGKELKPANNSITASNYKRIKNILDAYKIKLVCVQYPMRSVGPLKEMFKGENNVIFVDNERLFKNALRQRRYQDLFSDSFAGDFGHCTDKGNRLLAKNISDTIIKEVFDK